MDEMERRVFMKGAAFGALAFTVGGAKVLLTPSQARAQGVPLRMLGQGEAQTLEALGETLALGARNAGIAHFVDQQLTVPPGHALLALRVSEARPPYVDFYRAALGGIERASQAQFSRPMPISPRTSSTTSSHGCARASSRAGRGRRNHSSTASCATTRSTSSTAPWKASRGCRSPTWRISRPSGGGEMATLEKVDVVIVGAGAAGAVFAAVLTRAGKKVVLLEQGPDWQLSDLISSDIWSRRLKGSGPAILYEGRHPVGRTSDHGWGTGGAALHYSANFPRLLPSDFSMKSDHGRGLDWPISYADVAPYYDRVAVDIGVSGDAKAEERWRPAGAPYPMPPLKTFRHGEVWLPGFKSVGITVAPGAVGVNSTEYKGRAACIHDGWCNAGCPTGALANPQATYLGEARGKGAQVRALSYVTRVLTDAQGGRVTGVEYYDSKKERQVQEASVVVLAAFASQNPRLLFNSATDKHPKGLSNASGLLGKYIMAHAGASVAGIFDEDLQNHLGSNGYQFVSYDR
ncbi:MAG: hypothetical protein QOI40_1538, partial [Alphaproteobacteria bacterium]|nr:hypothetical protein [Alphaproteobacteria bacterium]